MKREDLRKIMLGEALQRAFDSRSLCDQLERHPYADIPRLLYLRSLQQEDSIEFESEFRTAAIHLPSRARLFDWLKEGEKDQPSEVVPTNSPIEVETIDESAGTVDPEMDMLQRQYLTEAVQVSIGMEVDEAIMSVGDAEHGSKQLDQGIPKENMLQEQQGESKNPVPEASSFLDFITSAETESPAIINVQSKADKIIDDFLEEKKREKVEFFNPERMAQASIVDNEDFVTDTLARIYMNQGNFEKALRAYKTLRLKYPEKRVYFADRIKKVQDLMDKRKK